MVELGGGTSPHPRADYVIDLHHPRRSPRQDATQTPWEVERGDVLATFLDDGSVDEVYSSHFLEHVPAGDPLLRVMDEAWRVLRPGGTFTAVLPLVGYTDPETGAPRHGHIGWQPWADPTHVSYWWLPERALYFCEGAFKPQADYGHRTWGPWPVYVPPAELADWTTPGDPRPFWTVREGWEGVFRLVRP